MKNDMTRIRRYEDTDWQALWPILKQIFREGMTYAVADQIEEADAKRLWIELPAGTFVILDEDDQLSGSYYIKPNQAGRGAHVCNCGYVVSKRSRGNGYASLMCEHSQKMAREMQFRSMQFNLVVSTNVGAVDLWKKHDFKIVGTIPNAFEHPDKGLVDAFVMYKDLKLCP